MTPPVRYNEVMPVVAALLTLALAGPVAAPVLSASADSDAIYAEITAGDPTLTSPPAPLERLLAATELAQTRLEAATDPDDASELLTLVAGGRRAAYLRTRDALHLCRLIAAAGDALALDDAPAALVASAVDFQDEARISLGDERCEPGDTTDSAPPTDQAVATGLAEPPPVPVASRPAERSDRRWIRAGLGTLTPGLVLFAPMAGLLAYRGQGEWELSVLRVAANDRPLTPDELHEAAALGERYTATTVGAVALGVTGAALVVTGVALLATGARQQRMAVAPWGARGAGGLVLQGRF